MYFSFASATNSLYWKDQLVAQTQCSKAASNDSIACPLLVRQKYERHEFQFTTLGGCLYQLYWTIFGYSSLVFASKVYPYWTIHTLVGSILFVLFNFLAVVVLLNVLVGMITKTLDSIEENIDTEWKFSRSGIYADFISDDSRLPSPFNVFPSVRKLLRLLNKLDSMCFNLKWLNYAADPEYRVKVRKKKVAQERLNSILKAMKDQHMRNQIKTEKKEELRSDDLTALRHDVSGLKFELLSYVKHVPKIVAKLNEGQTRVIEQIRVAHENHDRNSVKLHEQKLLMAEMHDEHTQEVASLSENQAKQFTELNEYLETTIQKSKERNLRAMNLVLSEMKNSLTVSKKDVLRRLKVVESGQKEIFSYYETENQKIKNDLLEARNKNSEHAMKLKELIIKSNDRLDKINQYQILKFEEIAEKQNKFAAEIQKQLVKNDERFKKESAAFKNYTEETLSKNREIEKKFAQDLKQDFEKQSKILSDDFRVFLTDQLFECLKSEQDFIRGQNDLLASVLDEMKNNLELITKSQAENDKEVMEQLPEVLKDELQSVIQTAENIFANIEETERETISKWALLYKNATTFGSPLLNSSCGNLSFGSQVSLNTPSIIQSTPDTQTACSSKNLSLLKSPGTDVETSRNFDKILEALVEKADETRERIKKRASISFTTERRKMSSDTGSATRVGSMTEAEISSTMDEFRADSGREKKKTKKQKQKLQLDEA
ncbi:uncharacterized protein LOC142356166 [Convolutriloba macropyga]|uniref:uncharacterized protein LOC142356166 n=1 Tax=Convolutriloba macropyga TaxID=536237 RepID=UPI003F51B2EC